MKIGVITHWLTSDNYGQQLQIYTLQQHLRMMGHDAYLIRYDCLKEEKNKSIGIADIKRIMGLMLRFVSKRRKMVYEEIQKSNRLRLFNAEKNKKRQFAVFKQNYLHISELYNSYHDLLINPPEADAYIVGSDQVWNPQTYSKNIGAWYLQFGPAHVKRIAYAASFGRKIDDKERGRLINLLDGLDAISVREENAQKTLREMGFEKVELVLDPTLLVSQEVYFNLMQKKQEDKSYVFLYYLNVKSVGELSWNQIEPFLEENHLGLKTVTASGYYPAQDLIPGHKSLYLTIPQWIQTLCDSRYVITNSFHGVALAVVMHRPFVALLLGDALKAGNERILSLLKLLHLEDRILTDSHTVKEILLRPIDWSTVDECLARERKRSNDFLLNALEAE